MLKRSSRTSKSTELGPNGRAVVANTWFELLPLKSLEPESEFLPAGSTVTVTCSPAKTIEATLEAAAVLQAKGHRPVPHLAARMVEDRAHVERIAAWFASTGVDTAFVIGGDADSSTPAYPDAAALIRGLIEAGAPLRKIGVGSYPDGHPNFSMDVAGRAVLEKQEILAEAGIEGWMSTQMCFDVPKIVAWAHEMRAAGVTLPIHFGLPGVVDRAKLMTIGMKVGIGASLKFLKKNMTAVSKMAGGGYDPNALLAPLEDDLTAIGVVGLHLFTFNAVGASQGWRAQVLAAS